jgi:hypothetical protein
MRLHRMQVAKPTVPQTAPVLLVTRTYRFGPLNFHHVFARNNETTEDPVLRASDGPDGRVSSHAYRRVRAQATPGAGPGLL